MTKTYNFYSKKTNNSSFFPNTKSIDYSSIIDNIILSDVIKKNDYLFKNNTTTYTSLIDSDPIIYSSNLKASDDFTNAAIFLANYKTYKKKYKLPYILGKMYTTADGTRIVFYEDEIQIGSLFYKYSDFLDLSFLGKLEAPTKKTIINIYTNGKCNIDINIL